MELNLRTDTLKCENCHKNASRLFRVIEPGATYILNGEVIEKPLPWRCCNSMCAKSLAAWLLGPGLTKMPKGWRLEEVKK